MKAALSALAVGLVVVVVSACGGDDTSGSGSSSGSNGTSPSTGGGSSGSSGSSGSTYSTDPKTGVATYYAANGDGNCGFGPSSNLDVSAFDMAEYAGSAACGACVKVTGPTGAITVRIVDSCPDCDANHLDLSKEAFAKIADPKDGRVSITYQTVACDVTGPMSYRFKEGSSKYWTAIQVRNHRLPIAKLEYKKAGAYTEMTRSDYNYFLDESGVGDQPSGIALRITAADGQVVEDTVPGVQEGTVLAGAAQFK